jgi:hypothetical protein
MSLHHPHIHDPGIQHEPEDEQVETLTEPISAAFDVDRVQIRDRVNFSPVAGEVFRQARSGAETFDAWVPVAIEQRLSAAARNDVDAQQDEISVEVPAVAEDILSDVSQRLQASEALLASAQREDGELSPQWRTLLEQLEERYSSNPDDEDLSSYDPWSEWEAGAWQS